MVDTEKRGDDCRCIPRPAEISAVASLSNDDLGPRTHRARFVGSVRGVVCRSAAAISGLHMVRFRKSAPARLVAQLPVVPSGLARGGGSGRFFTRSRKLW